MLLVSRAIRRDIDALRNTIKFFWSAAGPRGRSSPQTLKRAMCRRAGAELLSARMLPIHVLDHPKLRKTSYKGRGVLLRGRAGHVCLCVALKGHKAIALVHRVNRRTAATSEPTPWLFRRLFRWHFGTLAAK
jgi:hypothetical protein